MSTTAATTPDLDAFCARYMAAWTFYDNNAIAIQLGIVSPPGSAGEKAMVALEKVQAAVMRRRQK
jgi:hypothetical protein